MIRRLKLILDDQLRTTEPKMTSVYSLAAGTVTRLSEGRTWGRMLVIDHGNGYESWYMHLNNDAPGTDDGRASPEFTYAPGVAVGESVDAGQPVGYVGDSGNPEGSGPHTHFELRRNGTRINPFPALSAAYRYSSELADDDRRELRYWELTEIAE